MESVALLPEHSLTTLDVVHHADCFQLMDNLYRAGIQVDAIITDMPYGTTACSWDVRVDLDKWWTAVKRVLKPRGVFLTTASEPFASLLRVSNLDWYKYDWVWHKSRSTGFLDANRRPLNNYECICAFCNGQPIYNPQKFLGKPNHVSHNSKSSGKASNLYSNYIPLISNFTFEKFPNRVVSFNSLDPAQQTHPTQKPVALYEYLIKTYTRPGDIILDPFCGSGTTGLAALKTGRRYFLGDSSREYVTLARRRLQNSDPYQSVEHDNGVQQLSLFA